MVNTCIWNGLEYSEGATVCATGGKQLVCMDGQWVASGADCEDALPLALYDHPLATAKGSNQVIPVAMPIVVRSATAGQTFYHQMGKEIFRIFGLQTSIPITGRTSLSGAGGSVVLVTIDSGGYAGQQWNVTLNFMVELAAA